MAVVIRVPVDNCTNAVELVSDDLAVNPAATVPTDIMVLSSPPSAVMR